MLRAIDQLVNGTGAKYSDRIGGDPIIGTTHAEIVPELFEADAETEGVVQWVRYMLKLRQLRWAKDHRSKPAVVPLYPQLCPLEA